MIEINTALTGDITSGLDKFDKQIRGEFLVSAAAAMARPIYDEVKLNTSGLRKGGPGDPPGKVTGTLDSAVYRTFSQDRSSDEVKAYHVGVNKGKAPHWHLIEYGSSRAPAHPYLRPAFDAKVREAGKAGLERLKERVGKG